MTCKSKTCVTKKQYNLVLKRLQQDAKKNNALVYENQKLKIKLSKSNLSFNKLLTQIANLITKSLTFLVFNDILYLL